MPPPSRRPSSIGRLLNYVPVKKTTKSQKRKKSIHRKRLSKDEARRNADSSESEEEIHQFLMGDIFSSLDVNSYKSTKHKRKQKSTIEMTVETEKMLQNATDLYLSGKIDESVQALKELVKHAPGLHDPFHILGVIYEQEYKDLSSACSYYLLAAHLAPEDLDLWKRISEMSISLSNIDQAIYCLKKCLKTSKSDESVLFELSNLYLQLGKYKYASQYLEKLFNICPTDYSIADTFTRCKRMIGDFRSVSEIWEFHIESIASSQITSEALDSLATARLFIGDFRPVYGSNVVKVYICRGFIGEKFLPEAEEEIQTALSQTPVAERYALSLALGSVFAHAGDLNKSCLFYLMALQIAYSTEIQLVDSNDSIEMSKTFLSVGRIDDALKILRKGVEASETLLESLRTGDDWKGALRLNYLFESRTTHSPLVTARIELFNILTELGKYSEADLLLSTITAQDLGQTFNPPTPIPINERKAKLEQLATNAKEYAKEFSKSLRSRSRPCLSTWNRIPEESSDHRDVTTFFDELIDVLTDCELDSIRIRSHMHLLSVSTNTITNGTGSTIEQMDSLILPLKTGPDINPQKGSSYLRIKKQLDLLAPEDILGWLGYSLLVEHAAVILCCFKSQAKRWITQFAELLETIMQNRKQYKILTYEAEKREFQKRIEKTSQAIAAFFGAYKIELGYIKAQYSTGDFHSLQRLSMILASNKLAASASISLSSCPEKESLLEIKTWTVRHLIAKPNNPDLVMLVAHFCNLSGRWQPAIAEYGHAAALDERNNLAKLCLSASHLRFALSKNKKNPSESILLCFAYLEMFKKSRMEEVKTEGMKKLLEIEAYHHLGILHLAMPLYHSCLEELEGLGQVTPENTLCWTCPCFICQHDMMNSDTAKSRCTLDHRVIEADWINMLYKVCAHNLRLLYLSQGSYTMASLIGLKYINWG